MKLKIITTLVTAVTIALVSACSFGEEPTPEPVVVNTVQQPKVVSAEAFVVPIKQADLSLEINGKAIDIPQEVEEGNTVKEGDLLIQLDDSIQRARVAEAESNVAQVEANVSQAESGLAEAAARLAEAEANLAKVKADPTNEDIAQLQASLAGAEAALAEVVAGPTSEDIAQAEAAVQTARAQLNEVLADPREEDLDAAASQLLQAQADVRKAQADYDRVRFGNPPDVEATGTVLEKATLAYESAQANYDKLVNGATEEQIATVNSRVREAEAALAKVLAGATPEQIAQAQANVAAAQASLDKLLAGATDEDVAIAEAGIETARAGLESVRANIEAAEAALGIALSQLDSARVELEKTSLTAPFEGQIGRLNVEEGEFVQAGAPVVSLGDTSVWQVETDDLTEIDVVEVQPGAKVQISVDALPGEEFEGTVVRVRPKSETKAGDVTYTVLIDITKGNTSRLRWGMTTFVDIEADSGIAR